ncbi:MAG: hypothetical protein O2820_08820 [Planctomycetota bacterium]|nr:hypothetical protein [Planctomycetota bacterium]
MFNLPLRQAETALREGRLNEAFQLATRPDVREHRDGQRLITRLSEEFLSRGRGHLEAGRLSEARNDCDNARRLSGNLDSIGELASLITEAERTRLRSTQQKEQLINAARIELDRGECSLGGQIIAKLPEDDSSAGLIADTIEIRRDQIERAAERARAAIESGPLAESVNAVADLRRLSTKHRELPRLVDQLTKSAETEVRAELAAGRLDRAEWLLTRLGEFLDESAELAALAPVPDQAKRIAKLLVTASYSEATVELRRLSGILGEAKWLDEVLAKVEQAATRHQELQSTPFRLAGNRQNSGPRLMTPARINQARHREGEAPAEPYAGYAIAARQEPRPPVHADSIPADSGQQAWLLQVDGAGSTLLVTSPRVIFGSRRVDIPLRGFTAAAPVTIERSGGDYLIDSYEPVDPGGRPTGRRLLGTDESLNFGRRCRVRFRVPNPASTSAVLELNGPQLSRQDVRRIVLLDDALIAGPARTSHVVASSVETPCVVFHQDGEFFIRRGIASERGQREVAQPILPGESITIAGARFALNPITTL